MNYGDDKDLLQEHIPLCFPDNMYINNNNNNNKKKERWCGVGG